MNKKVIEYVFVTAAFIIIFILAAWAGKTLKQNSNEARDRRRVEQKKAYEECLRRAYPNANWCYDNFIK